MTCLNANQEKQKRAKTDKQSTRAFEWTTEVETDGLQNRLDFIGLDSQLSMKFQARSSPGTFDLPNLP